MEEIKQEVRTQMATIPRGEDGEILNMIDAVHNVTQEYEDTNNMAIDPNDFTRMKNTMDGLVGKLNQRDLNQGQDQEQPKGDFKERLVMEEAELNEKIERLYDFMQGGKFRVIDGFQKTFLLIQLDAMRTYWRCLTERINRL